MIRTGDTIENPITGERVTVLATSVDTHGEAVVIETIVQPHGFVAAAHVHPAQSERFAVQAASETRLAYVMTGNRQVERSVWSFDSFNARVGQPG